MKQSLWAFEKQPKTLMEMELYQPKAIKILLQYIKHGEMPHLLFIGKENSGKMLTATLFANELVRSTRNWHVVYVTDPISKEERQLAQRLADEGSGRKTISVFFEARIKPFISTNLIGSSFQIIIVDGFDLLGSEQSAFRRIMEQYSNTMRFILIAKNPSNIIDPIISRCHTIQFSNYSDEIYDRVIQTCLKEKNIAYDSGIISILRTLTNKNIGKSLILCQRVSIEQHGFDERTVRVVAENKFNLYIEKIFGLLISQNIRNTVSAVENLCTHFYFTWSEFIECFEQCIARSKLENTIKLRLYEMLGNIDCFDTDPNDILIQIEYLLYSVKKVLQK